jgi:hypothetical protein
VRLGQDLTVAPGDVVREATVVFGNATIAGRVTGDLRVFFGTARILSTAVIDGDFITVGGGVNVQPGATARRDVVVIGGPLDAPAGFVAGGQQVVIGSGLLGGWLDAAVPYLSRGLLWGRVIVPGLPWIWGIVALFFLLYAALNLIFDRPVRACALTMRGPSAHDLRHRIAGAAADRPRLRAARLLDHRHCRGAVRHLRSDRRRHHRQGFCRAIYRDDGRRGGPGRQSRARGTILRHRFRRADHRLHDSGARPHHVGDCRSAWPRVGMADVHGRLSPRESREAARHGAPATDGAAASRATTGTGLFILDAGRGRIVHGL